MDEVETTLKRMRKCFGRYAVRRLRLGKATLHRWRGTTPSNIWVEGTTGKWLWHSSDDDRGVGFAAFDLLSESSDLVPHSILYSDGGHPFLSVYVLKPQYRL